jgi:glutamate racemase
LGIFDSGLGGLIITKAVRESLPDIDILYYGDTLNMPYGGRSDETIHAYTRQAMDYMFTQDCSLIILACNTASATSLRRLQQQWLPHAHPGCNILGVVVPTLETAIESGFKKLGMIATNYTVHSNVYADELRKLNSAISIIQKATPLLVPMIENDGMQFIDDVLRHYLKPLQEQGIECLILGCTHYSVLKDRIRNILGPDVAILSQDEIVPGKLVQYLARHPEYDVGHAKQSLYLVSDLTENYKKAADEIYGGHVEIMKAAA